MKIGILGAGSIAHSMGKTIAAMVQRGDEGIEAYAVAARDLSRAQALADEYGFAKAFGSYGEMLADPDLDLVYIATPHSHHYEQVKQCMAAGKHVLCEKAFTMNRAQAEELVQLSEEKGLLLTEAIWTRYMPARRQLRELMESGCIGTVQSVSASLGYNVTKTERCVRRALCGGALLDIGIYPINFAMMVLGDDYASASGTAVLTEEGVDARENITMTWQGGKMAVLHAEMTAESDRFGLICGDQGYIQVHNINNPEMLRVYDRDHILLHEYPVEPQLTGYEYEVLACRDAIRAGRTECVEMPHALTVKIMGLMDDLRHSWGVWYPGEKG